MPATDRLLLVTHKDCMLHDPGPDHVERPERLKAVLEALDGDAELGVVMDRATAREACAGDLALIHTPEYVRWVKEKCEGGPSVLDRGDTPVVKESYRAALLAAGAVLDAVDAVVGATDEGDSGNDAGADDASRDGMGTGSHSAYAKRAFCAVRPPGHHAEKEAAMGFCLFNNVAVGARYAQKRGLSRVAVIDFDVHHGNGTEYAFYRDGTVLYISFHQYPHYPGTGGSLDIGEGPGKGLNVNIPLQAGSEDADFVIAMESTAAPALEAFRPRLLMISAGFDAHRDDPLSELAMTEGGFHKITRDLVEASLGSAQGRVVSVLEGGYNLESMAASALAHVRALAGLGFRP
jgi:acetoin utilization deacetylase AcuC-like enzyme